MSLDSEEIPNLVVVWHRFFASNDDRKKEQDKWAVTKVRRLLPDTFLTERENAAHVDQPEEMWTLILVLLEAAPSRKGLQAIAVGPLRQLMDSHFEAFFPKVKSEAVLNQRLAYVLSQACITDETHFVMLSSLGRRSAELAFTDESAERMLQEIEHLESDWFHFHRADVAENREEFFWAVEEICNELPLSDPHKCWRTIQLLLSKASSKEELSEIAEPIGELLRFNYTDFVDKVREKLPTDKRLAYAVVRGDFDVLPPQYTALLKLAESFAPDDPFA
jgi:hypothetical protein